MAIAQNEIIFNPQRDGYPGVAIAFVIDEEVVLTKSFRPSFANDFLLNSPSFSQNQNDMSVHVVSGNNSVDVDLDEKFTAVILSNPTIIKLTLENGKHVSEGWKYLNNRFFVTFTVNGLTKTYYGDGSSD